MLTTLEGCVLQSGLNMQWVESDNGPAMKPIRYYDSFVSHSRLRLLHIFDLFSVWKQSVINSWFYLCNYCCTIEASSDAYRALLAYILGLVTTSLFFLTLHPWIWLNRSPVRVQHHAGLIRKSVSLGISGLIASTVFGLDSFTFMVVSWFLFFSFNGWILLVAHWFDWHYFIFLSHVHRRKYLELRLG